MIYYKIQNELTGTFQVGFTEWSLPDGAIELSQAEIDAYNLTQAKVVTKSILETERKKAQYENITYNGKTFYATPTAQINLFQAYFLAKELSETSLNWLDINNQQVTLTLDDALALMKLLRDKINALYIAEAIVQNAVSTATTISQIEAVQLSGTYTPTTPTNTSGSGGLFDSNAPTASGV